MHILPDPLTSPAITTLLSDHLRDMHRISPPESVHALDLRALRGADISFWSVWTDDSPDAELMGCGALRELGASHGEIKSMRTAPLHRGKGVARAMLAHLLAEARARGYARVSLETGAQPEFEPARRLYASSGFVPCGPFGAYREDPHSVFMTLVMAEDPNAP